MKKEDIRTITFDKGYDVVLNMADGAIGYLEDDGENHKIFSVIAKALKNGGKHFMDIINGSVFTFSYTLTNLFRSVDRIDGGSSCRCKLYFGRGI